MLVLDGHGRVLLLAARDPAVPEKPFWFTPGGGLEPGESATLAAAREVYEETGLVAEPGAFSDPIWHEDLDFHFDGRRYHQAQDYLMLRVPSGVTVRHTRLDEYERRSITGFRWWTREELLATAEVYYPVVLPALLTRVA